MGTAVDVSVGGGVNVALGLALVTVEEGERLLWVFAALGVPKPAFEQASRKIERAPATPSVAQRRRNSRRLKSGSSLFFMIPSSYLSASGSYVVYEYINFKGINHPPRELFL
jgi:hypothetical protein